MIDVAIKIFVPPKWDWWASFAWSDPLAEEELLVWRPFVGGDEHEQTVRADEVELFPRDECTRQDHANVRQEKCHHNVRNAAFCPLKK
ncbi:hypothetical protein ElyMa_003335000 [Elysia marginata]|uniref:Uncharacterized protein n=1 Tax=Elysia marginata TaxID=1093978 RepID=A0AAV4JFW3_9GAST|nr:hypothetical protein ElyMa_003335000 [Elysia marginata]